MSMSRLVALTGLLAAAVLFVLAPAVALAGWRAAFLVCEAVPAGAVALLLVARLTGAEWTGALAPLTRAFPAVAVAFLPVIIGQAVGPGTGAHRIWLAWPFFAVRGLAALGFWWLLARRLLGPGLSETSAGLALVAHGILVTLVGTDWVLGVAPGQPNSAVGMVLATLQIGAASAAALLLGTASGRQREDFAKFAFAAALGLSYLLFMDFLIVWYGDLPTRVRFYVERLAWPWAGVPALAVLMGLGSTLVPAIAAREWRWGIAGGGLLIAFLLACGWEVAGNTGWIGLFATLLLGVAPAAALREVRR